MVYHVLNRANFRSRWFRNSGHYQAFLAIVEKSLNIVPMAEPAMPRLACYGHPYPCSSMAKVAMAQGRGTSVPSRAGERREPRLIIQARCAH